MVVRHVVMKTIGQGIAQAGGEQVLDPSVLSAGDWNMGTDSADMGWEKVTPTHERKDPPPTNQETKAKAFRKNFKLPKYVPINMIENVRAKKKVKKKGRERYHRERLTI